MSTLDKHMLKELLLVCSALGSVETTEHSGVDGEKTGQQRFVRGENCLEWLQDLQRCVQCFNLTPGFASPQSNRRTERR